MRSYISECTGISKSGFTVVCVDKIPRNESGKVLYPELEYTSEKKYNV